MLSKDSDRLNPEASLSSGSLLSAMLRRLSWADSHGPLSWRPCWQRDAGALFEPGLGFHAFGPISGTPCRFFADRQGVLGSLGSLVAPQCWRGYWGLGHCWRSSLGPCSSQFDNLARNEND